MWADHPQVIDPLLAALADRSSSVRRYAAAHMGRLRDPRAVAPLQALLRDEDAGTRMTAASALAVMGGPAVGALLTSLKDTDVRVRAAAASSLASSASTVQDGRVSSALAAALADTDEEVRRVAAMGLAVRPDEVAAGALGAALAARKLDIVAAAHSFYIARGVAGAQPVLIEALAAHGDAAMAQDFLDSQEPALVQAALAWATQNETEIEPLNRGPKWASAAPPVKK